MAAFAALAAPVAQRRRAPCVRCCAAGDAQAAEPAFFAAIRAAAPAVLAERQLAIAGMDWAGARLRVYISTAADVEGRADAVGATVDECDFASKVLGDLLDGGDLVPAAAYTLEVSTPGTMEVLTKEREFEAFKGFQVTVTTAELFRGKDRFVGTLHGRDDGALRLNIKGRILAIPRRVIAEVRLDAPKEEE
jgi:ribosome maturation factor RimP